MKMHFRNVKRLPAFLSRATPRKNQPRKTMTYVIGYLLNGEIQKMNVDAESRDHAIMIYENFVANMMDFSISDDEEYNFLSCNSLR